MKYALFLRGINVNGIKVPMAELRECLISLGMQQVKTFLQTGNVMFDSDQPASELKPVIEKALTERFGYTAFVLLYPSSAFDQVIENYPFEANESARRYVVFCETEAVARELMAYQDELDANIEEIAPGRHVVYWRVQVGSTVDSPFGKILAKAKYKAVTTSRNLNTLQKMAQ